jgi:hypothetical protein
MQVQNIHGSAAMERPRLIFFCLFFFWSRLHAAAGDESGTAPALSANPTQRRGTVCSRMMSPRAVIGQRLAVAIDKPR